MHSQQRLHLQALQLRSAAAVAGAQGDVEMAFVHEDQRANNSNAGVRYGGSISHPFLHRVDLLLVLAAALRIPGAALENRGGWRGALAHEMQSEGGGLLGEQAHGELLGGVALDLVGHDLVVAGGNVGAVHVKVALLLHQRGRMRQALAFAQHVAKASGEKIVLDFVQGIGFAAARHCNELIKKGWGEGGRRPAG